MRWPFSSLMLGSVYPSLLQSRHDDAISPLDNSQSYSAAAVNPDCLRRVVIGMTATFPILDRVLCGPMINGRSQSVQFESVALNAEDALTTLYTENYRSLVRLAATLLDDPGLSEEVVQDAYVKMYRAWSRIREPEAAVGYLRTTVLNLARSRMRRRLVARKHAPLPMPDAAPADEGAIDQLEHDRVLGALGELPRRQREVMVLRYYEDLSEAQIAQTLGISNGAVKTHASRAMATLRSAIEGEINE